MWYVESHENLANNGESSSGKSPFVGLTDYEAKAGLRDDPINQGLVDLETARMMYAL
jgi:hypothetical protein